MTKKLPTGIQTFADLRNGDYYYVDKTQYIIELAKERAVFLSRPRRFGKSLTLSTIAELFSGNKALFKGLYAEQHWDWSQKHAVIFLSFGANVVNTREMLEQTLRDMFAKLEREFETKLQAETAGGKLQELIEYCYRQTGKKVVVLVDEYDKPMLDCFTRDGEMIQVRDALRGFYGAIKDSDKYLRFAMLTGVSQFSKVNLFSGINHLTNITLEKSFSAICGYTQHDLETVFAERLAGVNMDLLKRWYNGYNWGGESVYNPYDVLLFFRKQVFEAYWYNTGSPSFLVDFLIENEQSLTQFETQSENPISLAQFDIDNTRLTALMFQTGYLTIDKVSTGVMGQIGYTLKYPNFEVQSSLNDTILSSYLSSASNNHLRVKSDTYQHLLNKDVDALVVSLNTLFASIPHDWYRNNSIARYEGYWASLIFIFFSSLGYRIIAEDTTSQGQIDVTIDADDAVFLLEFKVTETLDRDTGEVARSVPTGSALQQIIDKNYVEKYRGSGKPMLQIGLEFSEVARKIVFFESASA